MAAQLALFAPPFEVYAHRTEPRELARRTGEARWFTRAPSGYGGMTRWVETHERPDASWEPVERRVRLPHPAPHPTPPVAPWGAPTTAPVAEVTRTGAPDWTAADAHLHLAGVRGLPTAWAACDGDAGATARLCARWIATDAGHPRVEHLGAAIRALGYVLAA